MNANRRNNRTLLALMATLALFAAVPAAAQDSTATPTYAPGASARAIPLQVTIEYYRPHDSRGLNIFESPKVQGVDYTGFELQWGAAFTQQFQALHHNNTTDPRIVAGVNQNQLANIGAGFNNAEANLFMNTQIARGIRVDLTTYLSTRHHTDTWVKDGYILIDGSPWEIPALDNLMKYLTLKVGHFEINYGDMHFRRSDGGNTMFNPLVGNLIMDAFTTEVGGELYYRQNGFLVMGGATGGEIRGTVTNPQGRAPTYLGKLGFDRQLNPDLRVRVTGSIYSTAKSLSNTLYSGSRTGSRYFWVLENTVATESGNAWSGDVQPGLGSKVNAWVVNPFIKFHGLELFGNAETAKGRNANETSDRTWNQYAGEGVYRFCKDQFYGAARYNIVDGRFAGFTSDVKVERVEAGGGWFLTSMLMMKVEYVRQLYRDFPSTDIRNGGRFEGMMLEGVVSF